MLSTLAKWHKNQRGITGLETAIILIAFVVVASVFAYTVLSAGIFSSEKGKEAVYAGLEQARSTMELVGAVKAVGVTADEIDDCDDVWVAQVNVTATVETTDVKEGTGSAKLVIDALFATGLIATEDFTAINISDHYSVTLWIKSSVNLTAGQLQLVLDDTAACASPLETLNLPAITAASGWTSVQLKLASPSALTAVLSVGLKAVSDPGTPTIYVDLVQAPGEVTQIVFTVANALEGEAIDMAITSDSDSDGLLSDEATQSHVMNITYIDKEQRISDITWTKTQMGKGDSDDLLEPGEKMQVTVLLKAANPMPLAYDSFTLQVKPDKGSVLTIERTLPAVIDVAMDLK